ncbi:2321_t:CDS:1, partial [Acaulospora colombiana]
KSKYPMNNTTTVDSGESNPSNTQFVVVTAISATLIIILFAAFTYCCFRRKEQERLATIGQRQLEERLGRYYHR